MLPPVLALALTTSAAVDDASLQTHHRDYVLPHTSGPAEINKMPDPVTVELAYTGEVIGNVAGGLRRDSRYIDNLDLIFDADMEQLIGWKGSQFHIHGLYNNGKSISDLIGDTQAVSNIETGVAAVRLFEAWFDQQIGEKLSVRAGFYDLNSEFDALEAADLFIGSANGIGTDFAQSGENGPSIFPSTSLAARIHFEPVEDLVIRGAILDGVPGDPDRPKRTSIQLGDGDGALLVGELQIPFNGGKLLIGRWQYTADFERNDGIGKGKGNAGNYVRAEYPILTKPDRKIDGFLRLGTASGRYNMFDSFLGAGLKFTSLAEGRSGDEFGIALSAAFVSDSYRAMTGSDRSEVAVEMTYRTQVASWLAVQPNIHFVRNPSADPSIDNALIIGLRTVMSFGSRDFGF